LHIHQLIPEVMVTALTLLPAISGDASLRKYQSPEPMVRI